MSITKYVNLGSGKPVETRGTTPGDRVLMLDKGDKVVCATHNAGYPGQQKDAERFLVVGSEYTVKSVSVGGSMSLVWLEEFPDRGFNSVFFRTPDDYRQATAVNFSDIVEKNGRTVRQNNLDLQHQIPIGALVEANVSRPQDKGTYDWEGIRLYVVMHQRDCDGTPLYGLGTKGCTNRYMMIFNGFGEESLTVVKNPDGSDGPAHAKSKFDDLAVGDKFIAFPEPGDNDGHGGYAGGMVLLTKTGNGYEPGVDELVHNAVNSAGSQSSIPGSMLVMKVV